MGIERFGLQKRNASFVRSVDGVSHGSRQALEAAQILVLSGGDCDRGMEIWEASGLSDAIRIKAAEAMIIGISAGAMMLCRWATVASRGLHILPLDSAGMHEEAEAWAEARTLVRRCQERSTSGQAGQNWSASDQDSMPAML